MSWKTNFLSRLLAAVLMAASVPVCLFGDVTAQPAAASVPQFGVFQLTLVNPGEYQNRYFDVLVKAVFRSPTGRQVAVKGFYESSDNWKVRFVPDEMGTWTYTYTLESAGATDSGQGSFQCTAAESDGPVNIHPQNSFRWRFASGKPYFPIGLQDCVNLASDGQIAAFAIDGEGRSGPVSSVSLDEYLAVYGAAGFNLLRFSQDNCSFKLYDDLDHYRDAEIAATETLLQTARANGYRVLFGFFGFAQGYHRDWEDDATAAGLSEQEKRFIDYCVARWAPYVDFWELLNERTPPDAWLAEAAAYVRSVDPGGKPVGTSWERPALPAIDIVGPHWFESESEFESDLRVAQQTLSWKSFGKPVIVGEQGNTGMNWDPLSALRMRIRAWTALFQEVTLVFWNTSWSKAGVNQGVNVPGSVANIYLGPEERGYVSVLQRFSAGLDADVRIVPVVLSSPDVRGYALASPGTVAVYLHHFSDHTGAVRGLSVRVETDVAYDGVARWIDPATGASLSESPVGPGPVTLTAPDFTVDTALIVSPSPQAASPVRASRKHARKR